jgi:ribosome-associated protein
MIENRFEDDEIFSDAEEGGELFYAIRPNKTQIKQAIAQVAEFAEQLVNLTPTQLASFELPEFLVVAMVQAAKMPAKSARKRQLKYITAELRKLDLPALQERWAQLNQQSVHSLRTHHQAEQWRKHLLADDSHERLTQFLFDYPQADSQQLRQLQRQAKKERAEAKPPRAARLLYQTLKSLLSETG